MSANIDLRYCLRLVYDGDFRQMVLREDWINEPAEG